MIKQPAPPIPEPKDNSEEANFAWRYEKCRGMIEDSWLPEDGDDPRLKNTKEYKIVKVAGKYIKIQGVGLSGHSDSSIIVPYVWQHDYPEGEGRAEYDAIKSGDRGGVMFWLDSPNNLVIKKNMFGKDIAPDISEACNSDYTAFHWNGIRFSLGLVSKKQRKQEWKTICPVVTKIVSQFEILELN